MRTYLIWCGNTFNNAFSNYLENVFVFCNCFVTFFVNFVEICLYLMFFFKNSVWQFLKNIIKFLTFSKNSIENSFLCHFIDFGTWNETIKNMFYLMDKTSDQFWPGDQFDPVLRYKRYKPPLVRTSSYRALVIKSEYRSPKRVSFPSPKNMLWKQQRRLPIKMRTATNFPNGLPNSRIDW